MRTIVYGSTNSRAGVVVRPAWGGHVPPEIRRAPDRRRSRRQPPRARARPVAAAPDLVEYASRHHQSGSSGRRPGAAARCGPRSASWRGRRRPRRSGPGLALPTERRGTGWTPGARLDAQRQNRCAAAALVPARARCRRGRGSPSAISTGVGRRRLEPELVERGTELGVEVGDGARLEAQSPAGTAGGLITSWCRPKSNTISHARGPHGISDVVSPTRVHVQRHVPPVVRPRSQARRTLPTIWVHRCSVSRVSCHRPARARAIRRWSDPVLSTFLRHDSRPSFPSPRPGSRAGHHRSWQVVPRLVRGGADRLWGDALDISEGTSTLVLCR